MKKFFTLTIKKFFLTILAFIVFVVLHNVFYAVFGFEEGFFFTLAVFGIPIYIVVSFVYTIVNLFFIRD